MISAQDGLWLAGTFRCSPDVNQEKAERLTRAAIEFSKAIIETSRDCPQRVAALHMAVSAWRTAQEALEVAHGL